MTASSPEADPALSQSRDTHWYASWKLWSALLLVGLALIAVAVCIPTYRRMQAISYLGQHGSAIEFAAGGAWRTKWFGEFGMGLFTVDRISCGDEFNDKVLRHVAMLGEVKELYCDVGVHEPLNDSGVAALQSLKHLEFLTVYGKLEVAGDQDPFASLFAARPPIIMVDVMETPLSPAALAELTQIESVESLQISVEGLTSFRNLKPLPNLTDLAVLFEEPFDGSWLRECPRLTTLHLYGPLCDDDLRQIAELKNLESLRFGWGRDTDVTEAGVAHLAAMTSLTSIALPAELITPETVEGFRKLPVLERVSPDRRLDDRELFEAMRAHWTVIEPTFFP